MLLSVMASKGGLDDKLLTAMMEAVVLGWTAETIQPGLVCLSVLAQHRGAKQIPKRVTKELMKVQIYQAFSLSFRNNDVWTSLLMGFVLPLWTE